MNVLSAKNQLNIRNLGLSFLILLVASCAAAGQTPTNIQVTNTVQQPAVTRLGVNLSDETYWDSGQMTKNLTFSNPGFEGLRWRMIEHCDVVTANTCRDDNEYAAMAKGYWVGASYRVLSGNSAGMQGTITASTASGSCSGCGQVFTFDQNVNLAVGDYFSVETPLQPGNGDQGWADTVSGGGTVTTETTDLSPETPGKQALLFTASGAGQTAGVQQGFDTWSGLSFIQLNGTFQVTFRAKGLGGNNSLFVSLRRLANGVNGYLGQTLTLTNTWQDYTLPFTADENGGVVGPVQLQFLAQGSNVELDDVAVTQTNTSTANPTIFRDDVVNALIELHPGTIRMMAAGAALGSDIPNQLQPTYGRYRAGYNSQGVQTAISYGIHEFLQLCQTVGADPWITIPTATTPEEMTDFIEYLTGSGSDPWSTLRINRGQAAPWTTVFGKIHIELGNETWNGSFKGDTMNIPGYPQWANTVFGAARQTTGFEASKFDLILSGLAASPGYNQPLVAASTQHDSFDIAPYLLYSANNEAQATMFGAMFAEPELFESAGGEVYQNLQLGAATPSATGPTTNVNVYETNLGTMIGAVTKPQLDALTPSIGAGIATAEHMLQMMRIGVKVQNAFALPQYEYERGDGSLVRLWGIVVDMGTTNRRRPQFLTEALANSAIGGNMVQTVLTGANPTWNQPLSSDGVVMNGAHYLQTFAFSNQGTVSTVLFNLSQTTAVPVTFSGPNAPSGTVQMSRVTSAKITDNNETSAVVVPTSQTLSGFNPATGISLPPFSMTVLTTTSNSVQVPVFSVAGGTYGSAQTVSITDATPGAAIYYTTDGSTPTTSSTLYSGAVTIGSSETLQAIATVEGLAPSAITSASYVIGTVTAATPTFSVASGTYTTAQTVSLADATSGATIYYTLNGSTPTTASTQYTGPIAVSATETINAIASGTNLTSSAVATSTYTINTIAATPTFSVASGSYTSAQTVSLADATSGATIYYTLNGSTPTTASTQYTGPIAVSATETINAIASGTNLTSSAVATSTYTINPVAATPTFSVASGTYATAQTVSLADATSGATIYYTLNGSTPTTASTQYTGPIAVSATETINAIASGTNLTSSAVATSTYTINPVAATPTFSVASGTYATAQTVSIADATSGATIYYNLNGSIPTTASTQYTGPIAVSATETIKAIASGTNLTASAVATSTYTLNPIAATPIFSKESGTYTTMQMVSLAATTPGASIYYTVNGATPTTASTLYTGSIAVNSSETIKAIASGTNLTASAVATSTYTINPVAATPILSVLTGTYTTAQTVVISDASPGALIYYTANGTSPTTSSTPYTGPIMVSASETLKAIAAVGDPVISSVASATYTINLTAATPTFSVASGTYTSGQIVSLADATSGATIYYTVDGTLPTMLSTQYLAPITVEATETIKAIAVATNYVTSSAAVASYTISTEGFTTGEMAIRDSAALVGSALVLTNGTPGEISAAWYRKKVNVSTFTTSFTFEIPSSVADGFTFTLQNGHQATWETGGNGDALGYEGIENSVAIKFALYDAVNQKEASQTGLLEGGTSPTIQSIDMSTAKIDLHSGHIFLANLEYNGTTLTETVTDTVTGATFTHAYTVNIATAVDGTSAYVGFTASTGAFTSVQKILTWVHSN